MAGANLLPRPWQGFPGAPTAGTQLCTVNDIQEPGAKGITLGKSTKRFDVVVIRYQGEVVAFVNRCPHQGTPLDLLPDRFFDRSGTRLHCATHGAQFDVLTGSWLGGQVCKSGLSPLPITIIEGRVVVDGSGT